ncbi:MAG: GntR family transcriptional regulator [Desulfarculus sp.]|jgi:DNA-binding GntR family transcriptional regulator|nr:MAG: GntR family transcriptional regulator [Desulfarculus sp.]
MTTDAKLACSRAYEQIKKKIIHNELDPRRSLNEIQLAKELELSRTPIREALIMLEKEELITRYEQGRGFFVKHFSLQQVHDLYEFRDIIEIATASKVIEKFTDQDIEELAGILEDVNRIIEQNRPAEALVRAVDFHLYIIKICTVNSFIINALRNCYEKLIVISWSCQDVDTCVSSAQEHQKILNAIQCRDLNELLKWHQQHIRGARDRILNLLRDDIQKLYFVP